MISRISGHSTISCRAMCGIRTPNSPGCDARNLCSASTSPGMPGEEGKPIFMVYRYEDAQQMLRDNETFSSSIIIQAFGDVFGKHVMLGMDEPEHGRHRALVSKAFSQKALARWEDDLVGRVGNELIDTFADRGSADLVKEFNFPYPTQIIAGLLGLPQEDYPQFQRWSISLLSFTVNPERGTRGIPGAGGVLRADPGRPAGGTPRRPDQWTGRGRNRRRASSPTRRSSRSCGCCFPPASRPPTGRSATCCSRCCPTPINWTPCVPTARCCRRRSRRRCGGSRR